jgi:hypothetical protein
LAEELRRGGMNKDDKCRCGHTWGEHYQTGGTDLIGCDVCPGGPHVWCEEFVRSKPVREAIARITAADDVHYNFEVWSDNCPNVARINESGNRRAMVELKRRVDNRANKYFRDMDDVTLLSAPSDRDELQRWLQLQCDAAVT